MSKLVLSIDPGKASGWSLWVYDDDAPFRRLEYGLIPGGYDGFMNWAELHLAGYRDATIIFERFNPKLGTGDGAKDYEAMLIEGGLRAVARALSIRVVLHEIGMKALCSDAALKRAGLWIENEDVDWEDARDVNDSQIHALAYAKGTLGHDPTIELYWPEA